MGKWPTRTSSSSTCTCQWGSSKRSSTTPSSPARRCRRWWPTHCGPTSTGPTDGDDVRRDRSDDMTTEGIEAVFLETHNWGRAARFFRALGFELEFETDHQSGQL